MPIQREDEESRDRGIFRWTDPQVAARPDPDLFVGVGPVLTRYWVRLITENLPEGDPEDWRASVRHAVSNSNSSPVRNIATGFDSKRRRILLEFEVEARTGTAALETVARALRSAGGHPGLVAIRQILVCPAAHGDGSVVNYEVVARMFGPGDWKAFEEQQFEPD